MGRMGSKRRRVTMVSRNVYDTVRVSVHLALVLGLFPTYITRNGKKTTITTNKYCSLIILTYLVLFVTMFYLTTSGYNPVTDSDMYNFNTLAKLLILVVAIVGDFGTCTVLIQGYCFKNRFREFFTTVASIDKILGKMGYKFNHNRNFYTFLLVSFCGLIFCTSNVVMQLFNMRREKIAHIPAVALFTHLFAFCLIHHGESLFVICNVVLKERFEVINLILQKLNDRCLKKRKELHKLGVVNDLLKDGKNEEKLLDVCILCHDKLCDLCDTVNKIFGFLVIVGGLIQFNTIVFSFCYCYYSISIRPVSTLGWFFWAIFRIYELARKAIAAHVNTSELQETLHRVGTLMIHCDTHTEEKLKIFALQIKYRSTPITALGLFPINGSFAFTIIGATTTYITIIYQFQVNKLAC